MDAMQTSDFLLSLVKKSNLNFSITESPFSALISIRKTFTKSRSGDPLPRTYSLDNFTVNRKLQDEHDSLMESLTVAESEKEALASANHELSMKLDKAKVEIVGSLKETNEAKELVKSLKSDLNALKSENKRLKQDVNSASKHIEKGEFEIEELKKKNEILSENLKHLVKEKKQVIKENDIKLKQLQSITVKKFKNSSTNTYFQSKSTISSDTSHYTTLNTDSTNSNSSLMMKSTYRIPGSTFLSNNSNNAKFIPNTEPECNNNQNTNTSKTVITYNLTSSKSTKASQTTTLLPPLLGIYCFRFYC